MKKKIEKNTDGLGPSSIRTIEEELGDLKGRKDNLKKEAGGETCIKIDSRTKKKLLCRKLVLRNMHLQPQK
jgi:hypothetical protein